ncbi:MAG: RHS repeat-associated core domain-containing protein, partial [Verrucomicrobia bacterium]|nr:RHS repeat-associated core domain-containing protein [Verrucomicrobiota bacterium]
GNVFVPKTPESFGHDVDGNLTGDGRWDFTWDAENRLTKLESRADAPTGSKRRLELEYDWQGRRIRKKVTNLDTGAVLDHRKFLYDGWNLVTELNWTNNNVIRSYVWGLDLSGSEQGAGGVGGLLLVKPASGNPLFVAYDGNGNVTGLIDATTGTISAQYEYGPFGETIRMSGTGTVAKDNPLRFSTKYQDDESDLLYYGYRYYAPSTGRWLSRDPIEERGGVGLFQFVKNSAVNGFDRLGLALCEDCGADVTGPFDRTLNQIELTWQNVWNDSQRWEACRSLIVLPTAIGAWFTYEIATTGFCDPPPCGWEFRPPARRGSGNCDGTVAYNGTCNQGRDVHYKMFGLLFRLCGSLDRMTYNKLMLRAAVWYQKCVRNDECEYFENAASFAEEGYEGFPLPRKNTERWCFLDRNNKATEGVLTWGWWPHHWPRGAPAAK